MTSDDLVTVYQLKLNYGKVTHRNRKWIKIFQSSPNIVANEADTEKEGEEMVQNFD